jgi:hypothetical protein
VLIAPPAAARSGGRGNHQIAALAWLAENTRSGPPGRRARVRPGAMVGTPAASGCGSQRKDLEMRSTINWQKWFGHCATTEECKQTYKRLARLHHPDMGGDLRTMQELNAAFDAAMDALIRCEKPGQREQYYEWRASVTEHLRQAIESIITLPDLTIEICGLWVWVGGETRPVKEQLKAAGYTWARHKGLWVFKGCPTRTRSQWTMDQIRSVYGSEIVQSRQPGKLEEAA